jgi:hypothetical protein
MAERGEEESYQSTDTSTALEFYRSSAVGEALINSLNELLAAKVLPDEEALNILVTSL